MTLPVQLSEHLSLAEFSTDSPTARQHGIDNTLPEELLDEALRTAQMFERVRAELGSNAVHVDSGYRCLALNRELGSKDTSDHPKAMALDIKCPGFGSAYQVAKHLESIMDELGIGQLIYENTWVHISSRAPEKAINKVLTVRPGMYVVGIQL